MRRRALIVVPLVLAAAVVVAWAATAGSGSRTATRSVYFGWVLGTPDITAVAFDVKGGTMIAYVCDMLGPPNGKSVWFKGPAKTGATLTSASGKEKLKIGLLSKVAVLGSFTNAKGRSAHYSAFRAIDGAGIYEVTLDRNLHYVGTSTDGNRLVAQSDKAGVTRGTIRTAGGQKIAFRVRSLALAPLATLKAAGHSAVYKKYAKLNQVPGEYVAVIAPGGSYWLGRSGNVRGGSPGTFLIGLDKKGPPG